MPPEKPCPDCIRPVCMCILTLDGCKEKKQKEITGVPLNPYLMHDLFTNG
jgi:hypothetical protein